MTVGQWDVRLTAKALAEAGVSPDDAPLTLHPGAVVRLGVKVQRYLADGFALGSGPLPDRLPHGALVALARALPFAEESNGSAGKTGKNAIVYTADLAQALGRNPAAMEVRYKTSATRGKR